MKYKFFLDYTYDGYKSIETIEKGEIVEVVRLREVGIEQFVDCLKSDGTYFRISLKALKFCAEEYHEYPKTTSCVLCRHLEKCRKRQTEANTFMFCIGDFCARFEEKK